MKWRGCSGSRSSLTRRERTKLSTVRGVPSYSAPQQRARMSSRLSARPPDWRKRRSTLNSCGVTSTAAPLRETVCAPSRARGGGELDAEGGAGAGTAVRVDGAAVRFAEPLGDGEAQTRPLGAAGEEVVGAVEALEDALAVLLAHADSVVFHLDGHPVIGAPRAQGDLQS